jgi:hypothetical protein
MKKYQRIYKDEDTMVNKPKVKGKKFIIISIIIILIIFISAQLLYLYVIPRVTIDLKTNYHEATGGGGTGGLINVNSKFINSGTVDVENFIITVTVLNKTKDILVKKTYEQDIVEPKDNYELKLVTNGNSYETFYVIVELEFETDDNDYSKKYLYL